MENLSNIYIKKAKMNDLKDIYECFLFSQKREKEEETGFNKYFLSKYFFQKMMTLGVIKVIYYKNIFIGYIVILNEQEILELFPENNKLTFFIQNFMSRRECLYLDQIAILPKYRNLGFAGQALQLLNSNNNHILTAISIGNIYSKRLFTTIGFKKISTVTIEEDLKFEMF